MLKDKLKTIQEEKNDIKIIEFVIDDILDKSDEDQICFIRDVINNGCITGVVPSLIYYDDTKKFFKENFDEVFTLLNEYKENFGQYPNEINDLNSNNLSWWAYEQTMKKIANLLEIEY